jgi:3-dehydroquinate dehydratase-2
MNVLVVNGPNLNLLGTREPEIYGRMTLKDIENRMIKENKEINLQFFQSNTEGKIIDFLQKNAETCEYLIINPGAFTHTSIALRDAILSLKLSTIEVHLSNIYSREEFRQKSFISDIATGVISGFGWYGYILAIHYIANSQTDNI